MADPVGTFQAPTNTYAEVGLHAPAGTIRLKNNGPAVAYLTTSLSNDLPTGLTGDQVASTNALPLAPGEEVTVKVPTYPVSTDTRVPVVGAVGFDTTIAWIQEG